MWFLRMESNDPCRNLAAEEYIFGRLGAGEKALLLWQNRPSVIVGKHQNTVEEINSSYVRESGIDVVRRLSGGGAVYHDLGNLNYTLIAPAQEAEEVGFKAFCEPVLRTLSSFGVTALFSGRNDMLVDGRKFSGSARYVMQGKIMHHGTLLFDSDLKKMELALQVDGEKIHSKGIRSVRSRVTNLRPYLRSDVTLSVFEQRLKEAVAEGNPVAELLLTDADRVKIEELSERRYRTWEWNYGFSPAFSMRSKKYIAGCGLIETALAVENGRIDDIRIRGDFFCYGEISLLEGKLRGVPLQADAVRKAIRDISDAARIENLSADDLAAMIVP